MLGNDRMEIASAEVKSIRCRNGLEKSTWRAHNISPILKIESTSKFPRRTDVIIPRGFSFKN